MPRAQTVLDFWFNEIDTKLWFSSTEAFDAEIREKFESTALDIAEHDFDAAPHLWENDADRALALILVLDQFPRNMYRGQAKSFQWDVMAQSVTHRMLEKVWDFRIPQKRRAFVYMPYMHAESLELQNKCVELCETRLEDKNTLFHAISHREIIQTFGRFPHRNAALGRESTADEKVYLESGAYAPN